MKQRNWSIKTLKAFTLLEMVITLAIFAVMSLLVAPISLSQVNSQFAEYAAKDIESRIFSQQLNAFTRFNNLSYGIIFSTTSYTLFTEDPTTLSRVTEVIPLSNSTTITSISLTNASSEIKFISGNYTPSNYGSISFKNSTVSYIVNVNTEGLVYYNRV